MNKNKLLLLSSSLTALIISLFGTAAAQPAQKTPQPVQGVPQTVQKIVQPWYRSKQPEPEVLKSGQKVPQPTKNTPQPAAQSAQFRITVNGFTVNNETNDDIIERDGKRDEVFVLAESKIIDSESGPTRVRSKTMGDPTGRPSRTQAGSTPANPGFLGVGRSDAGGLRTGDTFPTISPWQRSGSISGDTLPLLVFEGSIRADQKLAVVPTIWEEDGSDDLLTTIGRFLEVMSDRQIGDILRIPPSTVETARKTLEELLRVGSSLPRTSVPPQQTSAFLARIVRSGSDMTAANNALGANLRVNKTKIFGDPKDRPIGMVDGGTHFTFDPKVLIFDLALATEASSHDFGFGRGVLPIVYDEPSGDLRGSYILYVQIEKL